MRRETKRTFELVKKVLLTGSEITKDDEEIPNYLQISDLKKLGEQIRNGNLS